MVKAVTPAWAKPAAEQTPPVEETSTQETAPQQENASADAQPSTPVEETPPAAEQTPPTTAIAVQATLEGEVLDMVTVVSPRKFILRLDNHRVIEVREGAQEMERAHAAHWYAVANGVKLYDPKA